MKKRNKFIFLIILVITACIFASCGGEVRDASESLTLTGPSVTEKSLIVGRNSIKNVEENYRWDYNGGSASGIFVETDTGSAMFYYARAVTLSDTQPLIEFEMLADDKYSTNAVEIKLIDIYDETNYVSVKFEQNANSFWSTAGAKTADILNYYGFENYGNEQCNTDCSVFFGNNFNGVVSPNNTHYPFNVGFDGNENVVYLYQSVSDKFVIADLDDSALFGENAFKGFTSDKVYISFNFLKINKIGGVVITKLGGNNMSETADYTENCDNLKLKMIDGENMFDGAVGYKYSLPQPLENDFLYGTQKVSATVIDPAGKQVEIDDNYVFTPETAGEYAVKYEMKDVFNNVIEKSFDFTVNQKPIDIEFDFEEKEFTIGEVATLPSVTVSGGNGSLKTNIEYFYNDTKITEDEIYLDEPGKITVKVSSSDMIGNEKSQTKDYDLKNICVIEISSPVSLYAATGTSFILPEFTAYDYINGREMEKSIYINGNMVENNTYRVTENEGDILSVCYYGNKGKSDEVKKEFSVYVISPEEVMDISSYFIYDKSEFQAKTTQSDVTFTSLRSKESSEISYPFALSANMTEISLRFDSNSKYDFVRVIMQDRAKDVSIYFDIFYSGDNFLIRYPYKDGYKEMLATEHMKNVNTFTVYFNCENNSLNDFSFNEMFRLEYDSEGNLFEGFTENSMYLSFELRNVRANAEFKVLIISNQSFNNVMYEVGDYTGPAITYMTPFETDGLLYGDKLVVPKTLGFDVLSQNVYPVYCTIMVAGNTLLDGELLDKNLEISLDTYGLYVISFISTDSKNNFSRTEIMFRVDDLTAPEITVGSDIKTTAKVNESFRFSDFTVSDNYCSEKDIEKYILIKTVQNGFVAINPEEEYKFTEKGDYECVYYAIDKNGNVGKYSFTVSVA